LAAVLSIGGAEAMAGRQIFDRTPDPAALLDELYFSAQRDPKGLPLGDAAGHARRRLTASYLVLGICRLLVELGRLEPAATFQRKGARHQDKRTQVEFPAAHVLPCDLAVTQVGQAPTYLADLFRSPLNRVWVQRNVFALTDRVHVLTNRADSRCEEGPHGMAQALARGCAVVASGASSLETGFASLTADYTRAAALALTAVEQALTPSERQAIGRAPLVDRHGRPVQARPTDTRLRSPDAEARAANKGALCQVLRIYANVRPDMAAIRQAAAKLPSLRHNELLV
jgi:hypothetical protein